MATSNKNTYPFFLKFNINNTLTLFIKKIINSKYNRLIVIIYMLVIFSLSGLIYRFVKQRTYRCNDTLLRIYDIDFKFQDNPTIVDLIRKNCLWIMSSDEIDVTGDGKKEIILNTSGAGCASCHGRIVYILEGNKIIFKKEGDDLSVDKAIDTIGFRLHEPLRRKDEPYCCPTEGLVYTYKYSPDRNNKDDLISYVYSRLSSFSNFYDKYYYLIDTRSEQYPKNEEKIDEKNSK